MRYFLLVFLVGLGNSSRSKDSIVEEGVCSLIPKHCSQKKQRKGVCCKIDGIGKNLYFPNFCLACQAVNIHLK